MEACTAKKRRKGYLHESREFCVPASTRRYRQRETNKGQAAAENGDSFTVPGTSGAAAGSSPCPASTNNDENREDACQGGFDAPSHPADAEESACGPDAEPLSDTHEALRAALDEYGTDTLPGSRTL